jgi:hypothetical protein
VATKPDGTKVRREGATVAAKVASRARTKAITPKRAPLGGGLPADNGRGKFGRDLWIEREAQRSREPARVGNYPGAAVATAVSEAPGSNADVYQELLDVIRTVVPAIWPEAADLDMAAERVRKMVRYTMKRGGRVARRRLSLNQARGRVDTLDIEIGVAMVVDGLLGRQPWLAASRNADADIAGEWEVVKLRHLRRPDPKEDEQLCRDLLATVLRAFGVPDPTHGVLRVLRAGRARSRTVAMQDAFDAWRCSPVEDEPYPPPTDDYPYPLRPGRLSSSSGGKVYLTEATADYARWRADDPSAPPMTGNKLSRLLGALPGVRKGEEGRAKVIVFHDVALRHVNGKR